MADVISKSRVFDLSVFKSNPKMTYVFYGVLLHITERTFNIEQIFEKSFQLSVYDTANSDKTRPSSRSP